MNLLQDRKSCDLASQLDTRLFAHIHSDSRLIGTTLEGNNFFNTAGYVEKVLKYLLDEQNKTGITDETRKEISKSLSNTQILFAELIHNEKAMEGYINAHNSSTGYIEYSTVEADLQKLSSSMVEQLYQSSNKELLIPGGWSAVHPGTPWPTNLGLKQMVE